MTNKAPSTAVIRDPLRVSGMTLVALSTERMTWKCFLNILLVALVMVIAPLTDAAAERKKTKKELAHDDCDNRYVACYGTCDSLIDINNQVENCRADCASKFDSCNFWADRARVQGTTGNVGGTSGGVLDPGAGNAGSTGGATTGGFGARPQKGGPAASP